MHHGYYPTPGFNDHKAAQTLMIEEPLKWGLGFNSLPPAFFENKRMVDVGCGVGGSSRYIVQKYGGSAVGVSLSPYQVYFLSPLRQLITKILSKVGRANELSAKIGLGDRLEYQVADAMTMPFADNSFDLSECPSSLHHHAS